MSGHVHECPQCHERPECSDACDIDPDLSRDRPTGAHVVCDSCDPPVSDYARGRADALREAVALLTAHARSRSGWLGPEFMVAVEKLERLR